MTIEAFINLDELEQYEYYQDNGVYIGCRIEPPYDINLYKVDDFFVELYYHQTYNALHRLAAVSQNEMLDFYLQQFSLN